MKRIVVRAPQWLGDAVVSTVFLDRLKRLEKASEISVLCTKALVPLFERHPAVSTTLPLPYPEGNVLHAAKILREKHFDEAYVLPRSFRAALETFLARIPRRIGYAGDMRRLLLTDVFRYDDNRLYPHRYLALINEAQIMLGDIQPFFPTEKPRDAALLSLKKPWLAVAPVSIAPARTWLPERFAEVANAWQAQTGGTVILFGSPRERTAVQLVAEKINGQAVNSAGQLLLPEIGWIIQNCALFLGNDSGLMHVAGAFQIPGAIVFGASDPNKALPPWGRLQPIQHKELACVPCLKNHCVRGGNGFEECLRLVSSAEVMRSARIS